MATAKKLPSGSWRVQVYSYTDIDGKRHYESFTAPSKKEAELLAAEWNNSKNRRKQSGLTVKEAIEGYIKAKEGVLSPSTIRAYKIMLKNNYSEIEKMPIRKLTSEQLQLFVSSVAKEKSPKYTRNIYGLLSAALQLYQPDISYRVTLPAKIKKRPSSPSDEDIQTLYNLASPTLKKCIALAAFGGIRRGEMCALTFSDLNDGIVSITKDVIIDSDNNWILKDIPKTSDSIREVYLPDKVVDLLGTGKRNEKIIKYSTPNCLTMAFIDLRDKLKLNVRFHDLRHYYASIGAVLGIPDNYLADFGGWKRGSSVMKEIYQNNIKSKSETYADKMKKHFDGLI